MEWAIFFTIFVLYGGQFYFGVKSLKLSEPSRREMRPLLRGHMRILREARARQFQIDQHRRKHPSQYEKVNWKEEGF